MTSGKLIFSLFQNLYDCLALNHANEAFEFIKFDRKCSLTLDVLDQIGADNGYFEIIELHYIEIVAPMFSKE